MQFGPLKQLINITWLNRYFCRNMTIKTYSYIAALSSFIIWGFISFCLRPLQHYPSLDVLFYRLFFSVAILCLVTFLLRLKNLKAQLKIFQNLSKLQKKQTLWLTCLGGLLLAANWFFYIYVMNRISIKTASFAYLICPILTAILAGPLLKEKLTKIQWTAVGLSTISCLILGLHSAVELSYSLIVAFSYAFYLISQKKNIYLEKFVLLTFQLLFSSLCLLPFFPAYASQIPTEISFYVLISILAIVFTIIPLFLNLIALKGIDSATMGILLYINPLLNFGIAFFYFKESATSTQLLAYLIILVSVVLFNQKVILEKIKA
jgi:chloramphenicol-sensitive protein RarD